MREQFPTNEPLVYLRSKEDGDGLRWWFLTHVGAHAEVGERSYELPLAGWSHYLAHAYLAGDSLAVLRSWLDRPWGPGDLYAIQRLVAALAAPGP